jgi:hypothetical protein
LQNHVEALEKAIPDIRERLTQVETKIEKIEHDMAKNADLAEFRKDIEEFKVFMKEKFSSQTRWFVGMATAVTCISFAAALWVP